MVLLYFQTTPIRYSRWDDELVIFNSRTNDTYLLSAEYEPIIQWCQQAQQFSDQKFIDEYFLIDGISQENSNLGSVVLNQLVKLNILQPVDCD